MPVATPKRIAQAVITEVTGTKIVFERVMEQGVQALPEEVLANVPCPSPEGTLLNLFASPEGSILLHSVICAAGCEHMGEGCAACLPEGVPPTPRHL